MNEKIQNYKNIIVHFINSNLPQSEGNTIGAALEKSEEAQALIEKFNSFELEIRNEFFKNCVFDEKVNEELKNFAIHSLNGVLKLKTPWIQIQ